MDPQRCNIKCGGFKQTPSCLHVNSHGLKQNVPSFLGEGSVFHAGKDFVSCLCTPSPSNYKRLHDWTREWNPPFVSLHVLIARQLIHRVPLRPHLGPRSIIFLPFTPTQSGATLKCLFFAAVKALSDAFLVSALVLFRAYPPIERPLW